MWHQHMSVSQHLITPLTEKVIRRMTEKAQNPTLGKKKPTKRTNDLKQNQPHGRTFPSLFKEIIVNKNTMC